MCACVRVCIYIYIYILYNYIIILLTIVSRLEMVTFKHYRHPKMKNRKINLLLSDKCLK